MSIGVMTYQDMLDYLIDRFEAGAHFGTPRRRCMRAIDSAYQKIANLHNWDFYHRSALIQTTPYQSTGTFQYVASTRLVTLTGATWPADVILWRFVYNEFIYDIAERVSDTVIKLEASANIAANVSAGASYQIQKDRYLLPCGFRKVIALRDEENDCNIPFSDLNQLEYIRSTLPTTNSEPYVAAISGSADYYNRMLLLIAPPVDNVRPLRLVYEATGRSFGLRTKTSEDLGTTITKSSSTVYDIGAAATEDMVGAILRISSDAYPPTSLQGSNIVRNGVAGDHYAPYQYERVISAIDGTTITLSEGITGSVTAKGFVISDPIDIHEESMGPFFRRLMEAEYAEMAGLQTAGELHSRMRAELVKAKENQVRSLYTTHGLTRSYDQIARKSPFVE